MPVGEFTLAHIRIEQRMGGLLKRYYRKVADVHDGAGSGDARMYIAVLHRF